MAIVISEHLSIKNSSDIAKLKLYRLIGEGYKAMQDGRVVSIEEVREQTNKRREERG